MHKARTMEGGINTPLIAYWPKGINKTLWGSFNQSPGHLIDVMATCVGVAKANYPTTYQTRTISPMEGKSLTPVFKTGNRTGHESIFFEHFDNKAIRTGDWKALQLANGEWELYDLSKDKTETQNLAPKHPDKLEAMKALWEKEANRTRVYPKPGK